LFISRKTLRRRLWFSAGLELLTWDFDPQRFTSMSSLDDVEKQKPTRTLLRQ